MISSVATNPAVPQLSGSGDPAPAQIVRSQASEAQAPVELPRQAVQATQKSPEPETVKQASEQINKVMQQLDRNLQFTVDEDTGSNVVKVIDTQTKDVIRQFPSEEVLAIAKALDKLQGLLIQDKA